MSDCPRFVSEGQKYWRKGKEKNPPHEALFYWWGVETIFFAFPTRLVYPHPCRAICAKPRPGEESRRLLFAPRNIVKTCEPRDGREIGFGTDGKKMRICKGNSSVAIENCAITHYYQLHTYLWITSLPASVYACGLCPRKLAAGFVILVHSEIPSL